VVHELLRHSSIKMTLDVYAQALTPCFSSHFKRARELRCDCSRDDRSEHPSLRAGTKEETREALSKTKIEVLLVRLHGARLSLPWVQPKKRNQSERCK
jgi:hypothetical protein